MGFGSRLRALAAGALALGGVLVVIGSIDGAPARAATVSVPAIVRDFDHDPKVNAPNAHPDFEGPTGSDPDIVTQQLGNDGKPVYGDHPDGTPTTDSKASFDQWFHDDATVNTAVPITLDFEVDGDSTTFEGADFFPIDNKGWNDPSRGNAGQVDFDHNFSFTMEVHMTFTYEEGQEFTFEGDDDVFVYFNRYLGIDLGGVHPTETQSVQIDDIAGADRANLTPGQTYPLDIFFAERHTDASNFNVTADFPLAATTTTTTTSTSTSTTVVGATTTTTSTSTTIPTSTTSTSTSTSTTVAGATTTSTSRPATTTTTRPSVTLPARTGSEMTPPTLIGFGLLALGALLTLVDRHRYRGRHFL